ncbi:MAG: hypothetical protein JNL54_18750 [Kineosporiaceae bacterium]|nr:hypothetical protein [Kineosporiaceae bacterium]
MRLPRIHLHRTSSLTVALAVAATIAGLASPAQASSEITSVETGVVDVVVVDRHTEHGHGETGAPLETIAMVSAGGRTYPVPAGLRSGLRSGQRVKVGLRTTRRALGFSGSSASAASTTTVTSLAPTTARATVAASTLPRAAGAHTLRVLPVYWSTPDSQTQASLTDLAQRTAQYWRAQSDGAIAITPTVKPWAKITDPGSCNASALFDRALAAHGVAAPTSITDHVMIYFPLRSDCGGWAGLGSVLGSRIWVNGYPLIDVTAHEFGHNIGLGHANTATCTSAGTRVSFSPTCEVAAYRDSADVMGYATYSASGSLNTSLADQIGLVRTVTATTAAPVDVELAPLTDVRGLRAVKVDVGTGWVYLDYRPAQAPDTRRTDWAGVQVHYLPNGSYPQSQLLDLQPWRSTAFALTSMPAHSVWKVPGTALAVSIGTVGATARVRVTPTAGDATAPSVPSTMVTRSSATAVRAIWTASSDTGTGVAGYRVSLDGTPVTFAPPAATSVQVSASTSAKTLRVDAVDAAGNIATGTVAAVPTTITGGGGDGTPSAPVITSPGAGSASRTTVVPLAWTPPATPGGTIIAYRVYADGSALTAPLPATTTALRVALPAGRTTTLAVTATNDSGLTSPMAAVAVTVDTTAPKPPVKAQLPAGTARVTWTPPADTGSPLRYEVTRDGQAEASTTEPRSAVAPAGRHVWTVRTVDAAGNRSAAVTVKGTVDTTAPGSPSALGMSLGGVRAEVSPRRTVLLSWGAATETETWIAAYRLRVSSASLAAPVERRVSGGSTRLSLTLPEGSSTISVTAVNAGGTPGPTVSTTVRVDSTKPSVPTISVTSRQRAAAPLTVAWSAAADQESGIARYRVLVNGRVVTTVDGASRQVTLPAGTLVAGRNATIAVAAVNGAGTAGSGSTARIFAHSG